MGCNFFIDYKGKKIFLAVHNYHNLNNSFYGIEAQILDKIIPIKNSNLFLTPTFYVWTQPKNQEFRTNKSELGGKAELKISTSLNNVWYPYLTISGKTKGWVAGDAFTSSNINLRLGIKVIIK